MTATAHGNMMALEIIDAFGGQPSAATVEGAFYELVAEVGALREHTIHEGDLAEATTQRCTYLLGVVSLIRCGMTVCEPARQDMMRAQLAHATSWLEATQPV